MTTHIHPPIRPAYRGPGYEAGWSNMGAVRAWGLTPHTAARRWRRKLRRAERKQARADRAVAARQS